jgi:hypothetical protein
MILAEMISFSPKCKSMVLARSTLYDYNCNQVALAVHDKEALRVRE